MERIELYGSMYVGLNVLAEFRIYLIENGFSVPKRPHLANSLVADPRHDATDIPHHRVDGLALRMPIGLFVRKLLGDCDRLPILLDRHDGPGVRVVLHVIDAGADIDERPQHWMAGDVLYPLSVDIDLPVIADRVSVLFARSNHSPAPFALQ